MPSPPSWHFREMDRGEINVDPVHDEFFKAQDLADALVREAIQNSLDARRGRSTVRVRFRLATGAQALPRAEAARYLRGLDAHAELPDLDAMPFLLVEDAGTRGLTGDPAEDPEIDARGSERNDFYYFWRNVGRSGKGELDRGRWGLGKAVFSVSSRIRTVFGLTLRASDERRLLLGQSVLKTHVVGGKRYAPYGFFPDSMHAIDDAGAIDRFIADFGLHREEPGLSLVVPYPREEDLQFEPIVASVIRQYFYPITRGDLVVTVEQNERSETITSRTIERYAPDPGLAKLCDLARWSMALPAGDWITIPDPPDGAPKWREEPLPAGILETLRRRFEDGERLAFHVPIPIRRKRSRPASSHFEVVLQKDETLRRGEHHFIRRGITIPEVRAPREKPIRALLIADDEPLSAFLGDAENPAHSDWSERNDKIRTLYETGPATLRYVKNAISQLANALSAPPDGRAPDLLADIFSISMPAGAEDRGAGKGRDGKRGGADVGSPSIELRPRPGAMRIAPAAGGFSIVSGADNEAGAQCTAVVAYRTSSGDPFRHYNAYDFAIGRDGVKVQHEGIEIRSARGNRIDFVPSAGKFHVTVTGFDPRRDLVVRLVREGHDASETELH